MSIFQIVEHPCPSCETPVGFKAVRSVNAGRHPHLRDEILSDRFQTETCPSCGASFRIQPSFTYFDAPLGLWINVRPAKDLAEWGKYDAETQHVYSVTFGVAAPDGVQAMGAALSPRLAFGWAGLREKIVARINAIDDVTLELAKLALYRVGAVPMLADDVELRLATVEPDALGFVLLEGAEEALVQTLHGPSQILDDIEAAGPVWNDLRRKLERKSFVDVGRLLVESSPDEGFTGI